MDDVDPETVYRVTFHEVEVEPFLEVASNVEVREREQSSGIANDAEADHVVCHVT